MARAETPTYSMRIVSRITGVSPDTIRKWESRYSAVTPDRSEGNTRRFSAEDVHRLGMLSTLVSRGHRIGDLATLADEKLDEMVRETGDAGTSVPSFDESEAYQRLRAEYLDAVEHFDPRASGEVLYRAAALVPPHDLALYVVLPILRQTGDLWAAGDFSVAHEHLVSAQIRGLLATVHHWILPRKGARKVVVATPEGHQHEFGAMTGALLVAASGHEPVYLGPNLPAKDLLAAVDRSHASVLLLSVVHDSGDVATSKQLVADVRKLAKKVETWVGLPGDHPLAEVDTGARYFHDYEDAELALAGL